MESAAAETGEAVVELSGVGKRYADVRVLDDITLAIAPGELVAITGRSGSGKSTLLQIVGGLDRHYEGRVRVHGRELNPLDDKALARLRASELGFVFQAFHLLDHLTVRENVQLPAFFAGSRAQRDAADDVLDRVEMRSFADTHPSALSGGQRQRVAIARALFMQPRLLLCDEPTGNLDATTGDSIIALFKKLNAEGMTIVIVTHEERVARAASRVIRLSDGRMEAA